MQYKNANSGRNRFLTNRILSDRIFMEKYIALLKIMKYAIEID